MRLFRKLALRWRITLLTALVLISCSSVLTAFSMMNAQRTLMPLLEFANVANFGDGSIAISLDGALSEDASMPEGIPVSGKATKQAKQRFDIASILFCLALAAAGTGCVYFVTGQALKPVRELSEQVSEIDEHNLSRRLPESVSRDEVSSLTRSFNHTLDRLDEAFQRQKRFSASAAHELKTPLATIKAGIQVLGIGGGATLDEYAENAHFTETSVDRMTQTVNDLLLLASAGESGGELQEEIYLDEMFEAIFGEIAPLYGGRGIDYELDCGSETLCGNASLLYRAFYNLVDNAYKYSRENGHISVSACKTGAGAKIDIADNGVGIPQEHLPLVFEAFYRVDASRSRKTAGSGLGLSIAKSIIEKHSGAISVSSENEQGTRFSIELPA
jgi:signal transduction histidine kinase